MNIKNVVVIGSGTMGGGTVLGQFFWCASGASGLAIRAPMGAGIEPYGERLVPVISIVRGIPSCMVDVYSCGGCVWCGLCVCVGGGRGITDFDDIMSISVAKICMHL